MDEKNKDLRPKRRKAKDNPYTLISKVKETGNVKYYIAFKDFEGKEQLVEVEKELYDTFDRFELDDVSQIHKNEKYGFIASSSNIEDFSGAALIGKQLDPDNASFQYDDLYRAIEKLTLKQKKYLKLHFYSGYTYREIAKMEGCSFQNIAYSIRSAIRVLRDLMK